MLKDTVTVNVGENVRIYVELHTLDTPQSDLKYGDSRLDELGETQVWYGEVDGWLSPEWARKGISAAIVDSIIGKNSPDNKYIYRVLNNDISFDEDAYLNKQGNKNA